MYHNYVFDFYGTLVDIRTNERKASLWKKMSELYSGWGAAYTAGELKKTYWELEQAQIRALPEDGETDLRQIFLELFRRKWNGKEPEELLVTTVAWTFRTLSREKLVVYEGVEETLRELKRRGKGLYLLSNAQADFTWPELKMTGLDSFFNGILLSSEEEYKKPAKIVYDRLFERYGLKPEECLMVGNDQTSDVEGAIRTGMDSLYIHTETSPAVTGESRATYTIMDGDWKKAAEILLRL